MRGRKHLSQQPAQTHDGRSNQHDGSLQQQPTARQHAYLSCKVDDSVKGKALRLVGSEGLELHHLVLNNNDNDSPTRPSKKAKRAADTTGHAQALIALQQLPAVELPQESAPGVEAAAIGDLDMPFLDAGISRDDDNLEAAFDNFVNNNDMNDLLTLWERQPVNVAVKDRMVSLGDGIPLEVMGLIVIHVHERELMCLRSAAFCGYTFVIHNIM